MQVFKEAFAILKPHITVDFASRLYSEVVDSNDTWPPEGAAFSPGAAILEQTGKAAAASTFPPVATASPGGSRVGGRSPHPQQHQHHQHQHHAHAYDASTTSSGTSVAGVGGGRGYGSRVGYVTFRREHVEQCLAGLASEVMIRERSNYDKLDTPLFANWIISAVGVSSVGTPQNMSLDNL